MSTMKLLSVGTNRPECVAVVTKVVCITGKCFGLILGAEEFFFEVELVSASAAWKGLEGYRPGASIEPITKHFPKLLVSLDKLQDATKAIGRKLRIFLILLEQ